jgi:hypothetical protein
MERAEFLRNENANCAEEIFKFSRCNTARTSNDTRFNFWHDSASEPKTAPFVCQFHEQITQNAKKTGLSLNAWASEKK